jgi:hypothetical protein
MKIKTVNAVKVGLSLKRTGAPRPFGGMNHTLSNWRPLKILPILTLICACSGSVFAQFHEQFHDIRPLPPMTMRLTPIIPLGNLTPIMPETLKPLPLDPPSLSPLISSSSSGYIGAVSGGSSPPPPPPPSRPVMRIAVTDTNDYASYVADIRRTLGIKNNVSLMIKFSLAASSEETRKEIVERIEETLIDKLQAELQQKLDELVSQLAAKESSDQAEAEARRYGEYVRRVEAQARSQAHYYVNQCFISDDDYDTDSDDSASTSEETHTIRFTFGTALRQLIDVDENGWRNVLNESSE